MNTTFTTYASALGAHASAAFSAAKNYGGQFQGFAAEAAHAGLPESVSEYVVPFIKNLPFSAAPAVTSAALFMLPTPVSAVATVSTIVATWFKPALLEKVSAKYLGNAQKALSIASIGVLIFTVVKSANLAVKLIRTAPFIPLVCYGIAAAAVFVATRDGGPGSSSTKEMHSTPTTFDDLKSDNELEELK